MKVKDTLIAMSEENTLVNDDAVYKAYANYLVKVSQAFADLGLPLQYMTLQNEPLFGTSTEYPGMYFSADSAVRLAKVLRPLLAADKSAPKLLSYDHNWDHPEYPLNNLAATNENDGSRLFDGVAWHCYAGDMASAHDKLHEAYPQTPQMVTECTGSFPDNTCDITRGMDGFGFNHEWDMSNILLGATGHYSTAGLKWILALDSNCGPVLPDVSFRSGRPLVSVDISGDNQVYYNQDFYSLAHMSRFVPRGSVHLATQSSSSTLLAEAFLSNDGSTITVIVLNKDHDNAAEVTVTAGTSSGKAGGLMFQDEIPPFSTKVYRSTA